MRIALVGRYPLGSDGFVGGVEASTAHLIEGLRGLGERDIHVITVTGELDRKTVRECDDVTYHFLPSPARFQTLTWYAVPRRRIHRLLGELQPDIVHSQNSQVFGNICLGAPFPVVVSVHGIVSEERKYVSGRRARARTWIHGVVLQRSVIRRAPHIIQPTRYPESQFHAITKARWHDTGNAIADQFFIADPRMRRQHVLYSGAIVRRKRLTDLVEAFSRVAAEIPDATLRVAGPVGDEAYAAEVTALIGRRGLTNRVVFLGLLDRSHIAAEYSRCRVLTLASAQETSPMVIAESMASSSPVIATDVGGVRYLVDDGVTGFVVPVGDVGALADRLLRLLTDDELVAGFGRAGHAKAVESFRSETVAARVLDVYGQVVASWKG